MRLFFYHSLAQPITRPPIEPLTHTSHLLNSISYYLVERHCLWLQVKVAFEEMDVDKDGALDKDELTKVSRFATRMRTCVVWHPLDVTCACSF